MGGERERKDKMGGDDGREGWEEWDRRYQVGKMVEESTLELIPLG